MSAEWTAERVNALAPDAASAKAGQGLASAKKWASLGQGDGLVWGECQGSGSKPYQTKVDPDDPAFSCSCPSRKFPCKHALGLMLIWADGSATIAEGSPPAWVVSWKENREKKAEKAKEKAEHPPSPVDLKAQAKREGARAAKVAAGLDDLALWINDLMRQGFTTLGAKSGRVWDEQARRMIDAQGTGVARMLRQIDAMSFAGDGWQTALLDRLARIHLLIEGFRHLDTLPEEVAAEVRSAIGFPNDLDAVRSGPGVRDHWQVIGQSVAVEDRLSVQRTWMIGRDTGRPALVLDFAAGGKSFGANLTPGVVIDAELAFMPGSLPLRALVKERHANDPLTTLSGGLSIASAFASFGEALTRNPWLELYPVILDNITLFETEGRWSARDASGAVMPLSKRFEHGWRMLAIGGGGSLTLTGEFDGATLNALGCLVGERFLPLAMSPLQSFAEPVSAPLAMPLLAEATASAVVGVDRKPPPTLNGDDPIGAALIGLEAKEPPSRLLAVAAAAALYGQVGRAPLVDSQAAPESCPQTDQPECGPKAARRLRAMLGGEQFDLLPEWLALLAESGRCLPADLIVEVLDHHQKQFLPVEPLMKALGVRGRWLAARNPKWRKFAGVDEDADPANVWETGSRLERIAVLRRLRTTDPGRGRDLVALTIAQDSAADRSAFLREFEHGLSMDDEPFLEAALDDRSKEVRQVAADLLRRLPDSRLCLRMIERSREILAWTNGTLVVTPPKGCDQAMIRDGIAQEPPVYRKSIGKRTWWLGEVVSATPTASLSTMLGASPVDVVAASRACEWVDALWTAWASSAVRLRDLEWADALLVAGSGHPESNHDPAQNRELFAMLPSDRRDALMLRLLDSDPGPLRPGHPACWLLWTIEESISVAVEGVEAAREVIRRIRPILDQEREAFANPERRKAGNRVASKYREYPVREFLLSLGSILPPELADEAAAGVDLGEPPRLFYAEAYAEMLDRLRFRRDMHREFAS